MIKILIVRLSSIGDIIHTFPMVYDIRVNVKDCIIDWVVDDNFKDLVMFNCNVDNVISIPLRKFKKNKINFLLKIIKWKNLLTNSKYDYIIDSQGLLKSSLVAKCFDGNIYGYGFSSVREKLASILYNYKINVDKSCLAITKNRLLSSRIFSYSIDNQVNFGLDNCINKLDFNIGYSKKYVVILHASSKKQKLYHIDNWVKIINYITKKYDYDVILPYGNLSEKNQSRIIKDNSLQPNSIVIPEKVFEFSEIIKLIYNSQLVIGVDTGLIHLSNALNKKTIAIYTNTDPKKTGIVESEIAKNLGNIGIVPKATDVINYIDAMLINK